MCSEISDGHTAHRLCWATVGRRPLGWKTGPKGRYVKFGNGKWGAAEPESAELHVSIMHAMGYREVNTFGRADGDTNDGAKVYFRNGHVGPLAQLIGV